MIRRSAVRPALAPCHGAQGRSSVWVARAAGRATRVVDQHSRRWAVVGCAAFTSMEDLLQMSAGDTQVSDPVQRGRAGLRALWAANGVSMLGGQMTAVDLF